MKNSNFEYTEKEIELIKSYRKLSVFSKDAIEYAVNNYPKTKEKINVIKLSLVK